MYVRHDYFQLSCSFPKACLPWCHYKEIVSISSIPFEHCYVWIIGSTDPEGSSLRERVMTILLSSRGLLNVAHLDVQIKLSPLSQGERFHMFGT